MNTVKHKRVCDFDINEGGQCSLCQKLTELPQYIKKAMMLNAYSKRLIEIKTKLTPTRQKNIAQ